MADVDHTHHDSMEVEVVGDTPVEWGIVQVSPWVVVARTRAAAAPVPIHAAGQVNCSEVVH